MKSLVPLGFRLACPYGGALSTLAIYPTRLVFDDKITQIDGDLDSVFVVEGIRTFTPPSQIEILKAVISGRPSLLPGTVDAAAFNAVPNSSSAEPHDGRVPAYVRTQWGEISSARPLLLTFRQLDTLGTPTRYELDGYLVGYYRPSSKEPVEL